VGPLRPAVHLRLPDLPAAGRPGDHTRCHGDEWDREPGPRIGERRGLGLKPLEAGTLERVARGILKLPERPLVVPLHRLTDPASRSARPVTDVLATLTSQQRDALGVQVGGNLGRVVADGMIHRHPPNKSSLIAEPLRTG
jgi:hypothetical protein